MGVPESALLLDLGPQEFVVVLELIDIDALALFLGRGGSLTSEARTRTTAESLPPVDWCAHTIVLFVELLLLLGFSEAARGS